MSHIFQVAAKGVAVEGDRILLLLKNWSINKCEWDLPGGRLEQGESIEKGLQREVLEELPGNTITRIIEILGAETLYFPEHLRTLIAIFFQIELANSAINLSNEHQKFRWVTREEFVNLKLLTGYEMSSAQVPAIERVFNQMLK